MPRYTIIGGPTDDHEVGIDYLTNGKVNGVFISNRGSRTFTVGIELLDGRVFESSYPPGSEVLLAVPPNLVTFQIAADGDGYDMGGVRKGPWYSWTSA